MKKFFLSVYQSINSIIDDYCATLKKYAHFGGVATRMEVINFSVVTVLLSFAILLFRPYSPFAFYLNFFFLSFSFSPFVSVIIRRLHDSNKSGRFLIYLLAGFFGFLMMGGYIFKQEPTAGWVLICLSGLCFLHLFITIYLKKSNPQSQYIDSKSYPKLWGVILMIIGFLPFGVILLLTYFVYSIGANLNVLPQQELTQQQRDLIEQQAQADFEKAFSTDTTK